MSNTRFYASNAITGNAATSYISQAEADKILETMDTTGYIYSANCDNSIDSWECIYCSKGLDCYQCSNCWNCTNSLNRP